MEEQFFPSRNTYPQIFDIPQPLTIAGKVMFGGNRFGVGVSDGVVYGYLVIVEAIVVTTYESIEKGIQYTPSITVLYNFY